MSGHPGPARRRSSWRRTSRRRSKRRSRACAAFGEHRVSRGMSHRASRSSSSRRRTFSSRGSPFSSGSSCCGRISPRASAPTCVELRPGGPRGAAASDIHGVRALHTGHAAEAGERERESAAERSARRFRHRGSGRYGPRRVGVVRRNAAPPARRVTGRDRNRAERSTHRPGVRRGAPREHRAPGRPARSAAGDRGAEQPSRTRSRRPRLPAGRAGDRAPRGGRARPLLPHQRPAGDRHERVAPPGRGRDQDGGRCSGSARRDRADVTPRCSVPHRGRREHRARAAAQGPHHSRRDRLPCGDPGARAAATQCPRGDARHGERSGGRRGHRVRAVSAEHPRQPADACRARHGHRHPRPERRDRGEPSEYAARYGRRARDRRAPDPSGRRRLDDDDGYRAPAVPVPAG